MSMIAALFVALTIFYNRKLRVHPAPMLAYICLSEAMSCFNAVVWAIGSKDIICYFGFHYLYAYTNLFR